MAVKYFNFEDVDKGIATEFPSTKVAWSTGNNVRITPGFVSKTLGKALITSLPNAPVVRAMFTFIGTDGAVRTIICCDAKVFAYNSTFASYVDITPSPAPTGAVTDVWRFALAGGLPILTNGKENLYQWPSYTAALTNLTKASGNIAPWWAKNLSSCMNRVVVSNTYAYALPSGFYYKTGRVQWSEPGNPINWTWNTTNKAGYHDILSYQGGIEAHANIKAQITRGHEVFFFT